MSLYNHILRSSSTQWNMTIHEKRNDFIEFKTGKVSAEYCKRADSIKLKFWILKLKKLKYSIE